MGASFLALNRNTDVGSSTGTHEVEHNFGCGHNVWIHLVEREERSTGGREYINDPEKVLTTSWIQS